MVQRAKIKFLSFFSILLGFLTTYFVTPIKNKFQVKSEEGTLQMRNFHLIRPAAAYTAAVNPPTRIEPAPTSGTATIQSLTLNRTNGQTATLQRSVDINAFESWLGSRGVQAKELSPDGMEAAYNEFRLEQISSQLDRIEKLLKQ